MSNGAANGRAEAIGTRIHTELLPALPSTPLTRAELRSVNEGYCEQLEVAFVHGTQLRPG